MKFFIFKLRCKLIEFLAGKDIWIMCNIKDAGVTLTEEMPFYLMSNCDTIDLNISYPNLYKRFTECFNNPNQK